MVSEVNLVDFLIFIIFDLIRAQNEPSSRPQMMLFRAFEKKRMFFDENDQTRVSQIFLIHYICCSNLRSKMILYLIALKRPKSHFDPYPASMNFKIFKESASHHVVNFLIFIIFDLIRAQNEPSSQPQMILFRAFEKKRMFFDENYQTRVSQIFLIHHICCPNLRSKMILYLIVLKRPK